MDVESSSLWVDHDALYRCLERAISRRHVELFTL
jgi:hypothetical protein